MEGQWDGFFNHLNVIILTEEQRLSSESFQTGKVLTKKNIYMMYILLLLH